MSNIAVTSLSSKGQVVIPDGIRKRMGIATGDKLLILTDGENVLLKPMQEPRIQVFNKLIRESRQLAAAKGLKRQDLNKIIEKVRDESRN